MHMQVMEAPNIRWSNLAGEAEGAHADGDDHAEAHAGYDLEDFRMAVVEGRHPNGESLSFEMPRWNLSNNDLGDLAEFLRSSSLTERGEGSNVSWRVYFEWIVDHISHYRYWLHVHIHVHDVWAERILVEARWFRLRTRPKRNRRLGNPAVDPSETVR